MILQIEIIMFRITNTQVLKRIRQGKRGRRRREKKIKEIILRSLNEVP